jgi:hypothetical protein
VVTMPPNDMGPPQLEAPAPATRPAPNNEPKLYRQHNGHPACVVCGEPVLCGQGSAHYTCVGMCTHCYSRPAAGPRSSRPDWCPDCIKRYDPLAEEVAR